MRNDVFVVNAFLYRNSSQRNILKKFRIRTQILRHGGPKMKRQRIFFFSLSRPKIKSMVGPNTLLSEKIQRSVHVSNALWNFRTSQKISARTEIFALQERFCINGWIFLNNGVVCAKVKKWCFCSIRVNNFSLFNVYMGTSIKKKWNAWTNVHDLKFQSEHT